MPPLPKQPSIAVAKSSASSFALAAWNVELAAKLGTVGLSAIITYSLFCQTRQNVHDYSVQYGLLVGSAF